MPLLAPEPEKMRILSQMPLAKLRAAAQSRGLAVPRGATRQQLASVLVVHTIGERLNDGYRTAGRAVDQGIEGFESQADAYPHICKQVARHQLRRVLDVGCGPGMFAEALQRSGALPRDGVYLGIETAPAAVEQARERLAGDPRFVFELGDGAHVSGDVDGVIMTFVLTTLDTHTAHRLLAATAKHHPQATLILGLTFTTCMDRLEGVEPDEAREARAARRYFAGDTSLAEQIWDTRRLECYRTSFETCYRPLDEVIVRQLGLMLWVGKPRALRSGRASRRRTPAAPRGRRRTARSGGAARRGP